MEELYLYFRTQATLADDDDAAQSCCFPLSSLAGYEAGSASGTNTVTLYFKSMLNYDGADQATNAVTVSDSVVLNLSSSATQREFRKQFIAAINNAKAKVNKNFLVIGDDLSTGTEYFSNLLSAVGTITVAAAHS